jgi:hypothetical protein
MRTARSFKKFKNLKPEVLWIQKMMKEQEPKVLPYSENVQNTCKN